MTLTYITQHLNTHEKCVKYLEEKRWNGVPICPYCKSARSSSKAMRYTCLECKNSFSVTVGTVFENSNLPLNKWLLAVALMLSAKKGISALQLARDLSINKNTAWLLQMKIRAAMNEDEFHFFTREIVVARITITARDLIDRKNGKSRAKTPLSPLCDGYWSHIKRAIFGQYHRIDERYLYRYVDEISYKYARRTQPDKGYEELLFRVLLI